MTDYTHTPIGSGYNTASQINTELSGIEAAIDSKLDSDGGFVTAPIDMNSQKLLNLPDGTQTGDSVNYGQLVNRAAFQEADAKFYDTMLLATADSTLNVGDVAVIKDRANGIFDVITVGTTANVDLPNTYNIVVSTADATKCLVLRIGAEVDMRQLGSTGLAGSDNTAIFNQAKTLGAPVVFYTGTYELSSAATADNLKIIGKGYPIIKLFGAGTIAFSSAGDNVEISGLEFNLDDVVNSIAISDAGGENVVIKNNNFKGHVQAISYNSTGKRVKIINNDFFGGAYGVLVNSSAAGERMIISNNTFDGNNLTANRDAIEINLPTGTFPYINITDNVIRNYDAGSASSGFGIGVAGGKHIVISGNVVDNCGYQGIHLEDESEYCVVSGNTISNTGGGTNAPVDTTQHSGIWVAESYFCNITDNVVFNSVGSGIKFTGATVSRHCKISDNMCYDNDDNGIEVSTGRFIDIIANHCKSNQNSGIEISGPARCTISANFCYNDSTPSAAYTQATGINITGTPTNTVLMNNTCYDNTTDFSGVASSSTVFAAFNNLLDSAAEAATRTYTPTNVTTDRAFDADTVALTELADVVGTLIADMQEKGLIS